MSQPQLSFVHRQMSRGQNLNLALASIFAIGLALKTQGLRPWNWMTYVVEVVAIRQWLHVAI